MARLKVYARKVFTYGVTIPLVALTVALMFLALAASKVSDE